MENFNRMTEENLNVDNSGETGTIVVGEHSAYKSVDDLIKGKAEADKYIAKLVEDVKAKEAIIQDLQKRSNIVDELKQIRETQMYTGNTNTPDVTEDAIKEIALKAMQESNAATQAESNLANCKQAVASINGDVELALKNKAQELDCDVAFLENVAKTNPKAFKSMFGIKESAPSFDSVNFLQSTRHVNTNPNSTDEAKEFFKSTAKGVSPKAMADFMQRALKDPSLLNNVNW